MKTNIIIIIFYIAGSIDNNIFYSHYWNLWVFQSTYCMMTAGTKVIMKIIVAAIIIQKLCKNRTKYKIVNNLFVLVTGGPVVLPVNKTFRTIAGQQVLLSVEFCANPPPTRALWLTESRVLRPGHTDDRLHAHNLTVNIEISSILFNIVSCSDDGYLL